MGRRCGRWFVGIGAVWICAACQRAEEVAVSAGFEEPVPETRGVEGGLSLNEEGAFEGYTLIAPYLAKTTFLVDMEGQVVHRWEADETPAGGAYLLEDGSLLRAADTDNPRFRSNGTGGRLQLFDWDGELLWDYLVSDDTRMQNHDYEPMPNGNVLVAAWEYRSRAEALAAGQDPDRATDQGLWPCLLLEIEPVFPDEGRVVWEWNAWDHLVQDRDPRLANYGEVAAHPELIDINAGTSYGELDPEEAQRLEDLAEEMQSIGYLGGDADGGDDLAAGLGTDFLHVNAVSYQPELDLIVLSSWELSEVFVLDHSTTTEEAAGHTGGRWGRGGDLLYRWGNPQNYGAGGPEDQQLFAQHDSRWLPGPRLLIFNNDAGRAEGRGGERRSYSTVDEIVLPFDPEQGFGREAGRAFGPAEPIWRYRASDPESFYGSFISGAHRLPNGNTFVCEGPRGRLFEVTPDQRMVWEYTIPFAGLEVDAWWGRFGWGDMGDWEMDGDWDMEGDGEMDEEWEDWDSYGDDFMSAQAAFRATRLPKDHPGLAGLKR